MLRALLMVLALVAALPASAAEYGPPAPVEVQSLPPEPYTAAQIAAADEAWRRDTRSAWAKFWISQGLVAADIGLTCAILAKGGREVNPIYGSGATCGRIAAIRGGLSVLQYVLMRRAVADDPARAAKRMNISIAIHGFPVIWNAVQLVK